MDKSEGCANGLDLISDANEAKVEGFVMGLQMRNMRNLGSFN